MEPFQSDTATHHPTHPSEGKGHTLYLPLQVLLRCVSHTAGTSDRTPVIEHPAPGVASGYGVGGCLTTAWQRG